MLILDDESITAALEWATGKLEGCQETVFSICFPHVRTEIDDPRICSWPLQNEDNRLCCLEKLSNHPFTHPANSTTGSQDAVLHRLAMQPSKVGAIARMPSQVLILCDSLVSAADN